MMSKKCTDLQVTAVTQTPYIIEENGVFQSETNLTLVNTGESVDGWVKITSAGHIPYAQHIGAIPRGEKTVTVYVTELEAEGDTVTFEIYGCKTCSGTPKAYISLPQKKIRHWTVYVSHSSHVDFGYTDYQEYLRKVKWPSHLDEAFQFIEDTDSWKEQEKFRHHIESSYLLYGSAIQARDADWIQKLKGNLEQGRLAYSASCMNTSMEVMGTEQLVRYYYYSARLLKDMLGIDSSGVAMMVDNPSISWANIDVMADAGIKFMYLGPNLNWKTPRTVTEVYPRLFYMKGRNPKNKVLIISGTLYNLDEMQFVYDGPNAKPVSLDTTVQCTSNVLMNKYHTEKYPFDAVVQMVDQYWDNGPLFSQVMERIRAMNERVDAMNRPYVYPKFINSNMKDFCLHAEGKYSSSIASYSGTMENWWCYGTPSDAYSAAEIRDAHDLLPAAETFATLANCAVKYEKYPIKKIADAYQQMMLYDEHTFGPSTPAVGDQHIWKRNTAITAKRMAGELMGDAVAVLSTLMPTIGKTISVYNALSWNRSDIAKVALSDLPPHFDIVDAGTTEKMKYQKCDDGYVKFFATDIPGLGYKCYQVCERSDEPVFESEIKRTKNTIENRFYKITLSDAGKLVSIVDKLSGNIELVDASAPYKMNEFVYMLSNQSAFEPHSISQVSDCTFSITTGAVEGRIVSEGFCEGTAGIEQNVILYDAIPQIDFVNKVYKNDALAWNLQKEEGYFVFPLNVPNFTLRHEMPTGDVCPNVDSKHAEGGSDSEQFYTSSTDFYTVNRWIDASSKTENYGITLSSLSAPIVQYGERRTHLYDLDYNTKTPWVYSYALNNKWGTNFMATQPGVLTFKYSLKSHVGKDWRDGRADHFGWETSVPLTSTIIAQAQSGENYQANQGQWIHIDADNIAMTTAKIAEANGEGVILRFNETMGRNTTATVNLSFFRPTSVTETDLMENDRQAIPVENNSVTFQIDGYGWKTIRIRFGIAPEEVTGVSAGTDSVGTQVSWNAVNETAFYEVFRSTDSNFIPGTGSYLGSTCETAFFDNQVVNGLMRAYFYKVRAVCGGQKGSPSNAAQAVKRVNQYTRKPVSPIGLRADVAFGNRVSLSWCYPADDLYGAGFKIYRDGAEIADLSPIHNSYLDFTVVPGHEYSYCAAAYDLGGNLSEKSDCILTTTARGRAKPGNIAPLATVLASSQLSGAYPATAVIDGLVGITGAWASSGEQNPWIRLCWDKAHVVSKVILYDRDTDEGHARNGTLRFSDGTSIEVTDIPADGGKKTLAFSARTIEWIVFQVTGGKGINVGLAEIEVFESITNEF